MGRGLDASGAIVPHSQTKLEDALRKEQGKKISERKCIQTQKIPGVKPLRGVAERFQGASSILCQDAKIYA